MSIVTRGRVPVPVPKVKHISGSKRVTLVIVLGFLPQNLGRWLGPMNGICHSTNAVSVVGTLEPYLL